MIRHRMNGPKKSKVHMFALVFSSTFHAIQMATDDYWVAVQIATNASLSLAYLVCMSSFYEQKVQHARHKVVSPILLFVNAAARSRTGAHTSAWPKHAAKWKTTSQREKKKSIYVSHLMHIHFPSSAVARAFVSISLQLCSFLIFIQFETRWNGEQIIIWKIKLINL